MLLLEDLSPARNGDRAVGCSLLEAEVAIREIAKFHAAWWEDPQLLQQDWLQHFSTPGAHQRQQERYQQRWGAFVAGIGGIIKREISRKMIHHSF